MPSLFLRASEVGLVRGKITGTVSAAGLDVTHEVLSPDLLVPQIRPGLEFVLKGYREVPCPDGNFACLTMHTLPVRAFEMIAGEPGRVKEITSLNFGTAMMEPFQYLRGVFQVHDELFGIEFRLGDEPVARVTREEMGL